MFLVLGTCFALLSLLPAVAAQEKIDDPIDINLDPGQLRNSLFARDVLDTVIAVPVFCRAASTGMDTSDLVYSDDQAAYGFALCDVDCVEPKSLCCMIRGAPGL